MLVALSDAHACEVLRILNYLLSRYFAHGLGVCVVPSIVAQLWQRCSALGGDAVHYLIDVDFVILHELSSYRVLHHLLELHAASPLL